MSDASSKHPDFETLAGLAEGRLSADRRTAVLAHLDECEGCMSEVELANEAIQQEQVNVAASHPRQAWTWLVAAGVVVAMLGYALLRQPWRRSPESLLVAAVPRSARLVEARLTGGFAWAAYRGAARSAQTHADPELLRLDGAAADAIERGKRDPSAPAQHTAGVALVLIDHPLDAVDRLRAAAAAAPNDARNWSDLAAAEYSAAQSLGRPSLYAQALGDAEHAVRLDPRLPEALFNRALILGRMGLLDEERRAWSDYLAIDTNSEWAVEARHRLALLSGDAAPPFERNRSRIEAAAAAGDAATVRAIVDGDRERARTFGEVEYLGRWGEALQRGDAAGAAAALAVSRACGDALAALSGESLLRDAVRVIDSAGDRASLAEAHVVYRRARILYSKGNPSGAEDGLRRAAALFAAAGDPLAFIARYYAASARFDRHDTAAARQELEALAAELRERPQYIDAAAQVQWELGLCRSAGGDWSGGLASFSDAAAGYRRLGERSNLAMMNGLRAWILDLLGRPEEAWAARIDALAAESRARRGDRLATALRWATDAEARAGHGDAARALLVMEARMHRSAGNDDQLVHALARETELDVSLGDDAAALAAAEEARRTAARVADPALRMREIAVAQLAAAGAELRRDPAKARGLAAEAARGLEAGGLRVRLPDAALLRARAAIRLGDRDAAARDLDDGIAALTLLRVDVGAGGITTGIDDTARQLFEEAVRLHVDRDASAAFAYAEHARILDRNVTVDARALQQRLAGSGTVVIEPFVLRDEVIVFAIDERGVTASRHRIARADLDALVARGAATELYDALIRPAEATVAHARHLVVVPDPHVVDVAFAALHDGKRYLVEQLPVSIAPSASSLTRSPWHAPRSIVATALGDVADGALAALPESAGEVADIARLYPRSETLPHATLAALRDAAAHADVVHVAGHTMRDGSGDPALLLGDHERVAWSDIAAQPFAHAETVSLSACETLRHAVRADAHARSLGGAFLAAGAHYVVGTLTPITDVDARTMFKEIHRQLAAGVEPSEAVRRAQLTEMTARRGGWQAVAVMSNVIPF